MKKYTYETCVLSNIPHNESMQRQLHDIANALSLFTGAKVTWICRDETNGFFRVETDELPHHTMEIGEHWDALHK